MSTFQQNGCEHSEVTCAYAAQALAPSEVAAAEAHISLCPDCQREVESLRTVVDTFLSWPTDVLRPTTSLQARLALHIAEEDGKEPFAPDHFCKIMAVARGCRPDRSDPTLGRPFGRGEVISRRSVLAAIAAHP